ncbi:hypothetical protein HDU82_002327 [Entophlyctis luteolus]|nr:hypothetical protein HDU82_002327 [Entophlyctis luteolus]
MNQLLSELDDLMLSLSTDNSSNGGSGGDDGGGDKGRGNSSLAESKVSESDRAAPSANGRNGDDWVLGFYSTSSAVGRLPDDEVSSNASSQTIAPPPPSVHQIPQRAATGPLRQKSVPILRGRGQSRVPQIALGQLKQSQITMSAYLFKLNDDEPDARSKWQQGYFVLGEDANLFQYNIEASPTSLPVFHVLITSCYAFVDGSGSHLLRITSDKENQSCVLRFPDEKTVNNWVRTIGLMRVSHTNVTPPSPSSLHFGLRPPTVDSDTGARHFGNAMQYVPPGRGSSQSPRPFTSGSPYIPIATSSFIDQSLLQSPIGSDHTLGPNSGVLRNFPPDGLPNGVNRTDSVFSGNSGHSASSGGTGGAVIRSQSPQFPQAYIPPMMTQRTPSTASSGYRKVVTADGTAPSKDGGRTQSGGKSKMLELAEMDRRYKQAALERMKEAKENSEVQAEAVKLRAALGL